MNHLAVAVTKNRLLPHPVRLRNGKLKFTRSDGDEFSRQCLAYRDHHEARGDEVETLLIPTPKLPAQEALYGHLSLYHGDLDVLAIFHHGTPSGLPGFALGRKNVGELADRIIGAAGDKVTILLYACLTGKGRYLFGQKTPDGRKLTRKETNEGDRIKSADNVDHREGFAMLLTAELSKRGCIATVYAHLTSGHTTENPFKVRVSSRWFFGDARVNEVARAKVVQPYGATWKHWMQRMQGADRFDYWCPAIPGASER